MSENQENNTNKQEQVNSTTNATVNNTQSNVNYSNTRNDNIPNEYKPLSPWAYVGYNFLFSIPIAGFIMMIIFAFDSSNINRRNYARSFFCAMLIGIIVSIIILILVFVLGFSIFSLESGTITSSLS